MAAWSVMMDTYRPPYAVYTEEVRPMITTMGHRTVPITISNRSPGTPRGRRQSYTGDVKC